MLVAGIENVKMSPPKAAPEELLQTVTRIQPMFKRT